MPFELGLFLGFSLIISIGAQNLFVIKQGIKKEYSILVPLICTLSDALLITLSVTTLGKIIFHLSSVKIIMLILAVIFLFFYGGKSLLHGLTTSTKKIILTQENKNNSEKFWRTILITLGFSLLNPQAIIEMTMIMGGIATHYHSMQWQFILGAILASAIWFFSLTWISRFFAKLILNPIAWRVMEILSGMIMLMIAVSLIFECVAGT